MQRDAGESLDKPTAKWISRALGKTVYDHYWQTETGWPLITPLAGVGKTPVKFGSYGYDVRLLHEVTGEEVGDGEKGVVTVVRPLPPGCMTTVWGQDERFVQTYLTSFGDRLIYTKFDWGIRDKDGYYFDLGRSDDVINVAGHRLGTREIEEAVSAHPAIAEVAVVGVADPLKGEMPIAFVVVKDAPAVSTRGEVQPARERSDAYGRRVAGCDWPASACSLRHAASEDPIRKSLAPFYSGDRGESRSGRSHQSGRSVWNRADTNCV